MDYVRDVLERVTQLRENGATSGAGLLATYAGACPRAGPWPDPGDAFGRAVSLTRGNGANTSAGYDAASRLSSLVHNLAGTGSDVSYAFTYNPASQILSRAQPGGAYAWTNHPAGTVNKAYDGLNRDAAIAALGSPTAGYDARGNLANDGTRQYTYDILNRLLTVSGSPGLTLAYDPAGRLASTTSGGTVTRFQYDGDQLVAEYSSSGALLRRYVPGPAGADDPVVWYEGSGTADRRWLLTDERGSAVGWANGSGALIAAQAYGAYGEPQSWTGSRYAYTGQISLPEAQLYSYKARVYDPMAGRFLQTDPAGLDAGMNLYAYVGGDPVNATDPSGMSECRGLNRQNWCPPPPWEEWRGPGSPSGQGYIQVGSDSGARYWVFYQGSIAALASVQVNGGATGTGTSSAQAAGGGGGSQSRSSCPGAALQRAGNVAGDVGTAHDGFVRAVAAPFDPAIAKGAERSLGRVSSVLTVFAQGLGGAGDLRNGVPVDVVLVTRSARAAYTLFFGGLGAVAGGAAGSLGGPAAEFTIPAGAFGGLAAGGYIGDQAGAFVGGQYKYVRSLVVKSRAGGC